MPSQPQEQARPQTLKVKHWTGNAYFGFHRPPPPEIPDTKACLCPQCELLAWADSRWCWHCGFELHPAALAPFHPVKVLAVALFLALGALLLVLVKFTL